MGKGGGGGSNPSAFTGGAPATPPPVGSSVRGATPTYQNFIAGLGGSQPATPESIAQVAMSTPPPGVNLAPVPAATPSGPTDVNSLRNMLAQVMNPSQLLSGEDKLMMAMGGSAPSWYTPEMQNRARNDRLTNIFASSMGSGPMGPRSGR